MGEQELEVEGKGEYSRLRVEQLEEEMSARLYVEYRPGGGGGIEVQEYELVGELGEAGEREGVGREDEAKFGGGVSEQGGEEYVGCSQGRSGSRGGMVTLMVLLVLLGVVRRLRRNGNVGL